MIVLRDAADMPVVGAAASSDHADVREARKKLRAELAEFGGVAIVQHFGGVEFGVAQARRIGAYPADPERPRGISVERVAEVIRMGPELKLAAARRKALTLKYARDAGRRLQSALDPGGTR